MFVSRHIIFNESQFHFQTPTPHPTSTASPSPPPPLSNLLLQSLPNSPNPPPNPVQPPSHPSQTYTFPSLPESPQTVTPPTITPTTIPSPVIPHQPTHHRLTRAKTDNLKPKIPFSLLHSTSLIIEPTSLSQALKHPEWRQAMSQEFQVLQAQGTWSLVPPPPNQTILGSRWTYRLKYNTDGSIARYKACLVAQGHKQQQGNDYHETFS